jgi:hypothetical protein
VPITFTGALALEDVHPRREFCHGLHPGEHRRARGLEPRGRNRDWRDRSGRAARARAPAARALLGRRRSRDLSARPEAGGRAQITGSAASADGPAGPVLLYLPSDPAVRVSPFTRIAGLPIAERVLRSAFRAHYARLVVFCDPTLAPRLDASGAPIRATSGSSPRPRVARPLARCLHTVATASAPASCLPPPARGRPRRGQPVRGAAGSDPGS